MYLPKFNEIIEDLNNCLNFMVSEARRMVRGPNESENVSKVRFYINVNCTSKGSTHFILFRNM